jgi:ketosteroid isomerase-like protein
MSQDQQSIVEALEGFARAMRDMDLEGLQRLWDAEHEHVLYQPEEYPRACRTWDEIVDYWRHIPDVVDKIQEWRLLESDIAVLGDAAIVHALFDTSFVIKGMAEPLDGEVRFTFGLRRSGDGWLFIHAHESRQLVVE